VNSPATESAKTLGQVVAVVCAALLFSMIAHKMYADVSMLARLHSGQEFWLALARRLIANLAG